jgi:amino acid adenylation domain-containing protein
MSVLNLLSSLEELDIYVDVAEGNLKVNAPKGKLTPDIISQLKDKKGEIIEFFESVERRQVQYVSIGPAEKKEFYELSAAQKRLYFLQQMNLNRVDYNMPYVTELDESIDMKKLEETFKKLIRRHESLRTSFKMIDERMMQMIQPDVVFKAEYYDLDQQDKDSGDSSLTPANIFKEFVRSFNLAQAPLLRAGLVRTREKRNVLMVDTHHIVSDGISQQVLLRDFISLYNGEELPPLRLQYKDYVEWQGGETQKRVNQQQETYWVNEFSGDIQLLNLPTDYPRGLIQNIEGDTVYFEIPQKETEGLKKMALEARGTLYMVLLAVFNILLSRLSGQEDIIVGVPVAGRRHTDLESVIGMFVNTLVLRNYPKSTWTFGEFLKNLGERTFNAFENQDYQFQDLVEKVMTERDASRNPLFDVMIDLQNMGENTDEMPAQDVLLETVEHEFKNQSSRFDMTWNGMERGGRLFFGIEFCIKLFKKDTILRFINYFKKIVTTVSGSGSWEYKIKDIEIIPEDEKKQVLLDFNNTDAGCPTDATFSRLFEEQAARVPGKTAVTFNDGQLTYSELNRRANRLARFLRKRGVTAGSIVPIMTGRSLEMIIAVAAVLKAGAAYLPVAPSYPPARIKYMLTDSGVSLLLTGAGKDEEHQVDFPGERIDINTGEADGLHQGNLEPLNKPEDLAYVIYTSGSTGRPKGVMVQHDQYINAAFGWRTVYRLTEMEVNLLQMAAFSFDVFAGDLARALLNGGKLVICPEETRLAPPSLYYLIRNSRITLFEATPALVLPFMEFVYENQLDIGNLKLLILGSDTCRAEEFKMLFYRFGGNMRIVNTYGVTEASIDSSYYEGSVEDVPSLGNIPIGKPFPNVKLYVVNGFGRLQAIGVPGELYIGGKGVARGYMNNGLLTDGRFIASPFNEGQGVFRTGDLVKWASDGNLEFLGRIDNQVKIRGHRIELGEIERLLLKHPDIKGAVVAAKRNSTEICAYIVSDRQFEQYQLSGFLSNELPSYMVPSHFIQLEKIPLTPNGKVDTNALPEPEAGAAADDRYEPPVNEIEEKLVEIWAGILELEKEKIGVETSFFALGGNSINLIMLVSKIYKEIGVEVSIVQIYDSPLIREIGKFVAARKYVEYPVVLFNSLQEKRIFCFPPSIGLGIVFKPFAILLDDCSVYGVNFIESEDRLSQYVDAITGQEPNGPYIFLGYSCAGEITMEVAKALEDRGLEVSDIIFCDCFFQEGVEMEIKERTLNRYTGNIEKRLEEWGVAFVKDKVIGKTTKYLRYAQTTTELKPVNANIHLILSETNKDIEEKNCWDKLTHNISAIYYGFGHHTGMFDPGALEENVKVIRKILNLP